MAFDNPWGTWKKAPMGRLMPCTSATDALDEDFRKLVLRPCNAFSISSSTGIPRETVRRKVARLAELGWIVRDSRGGLTITAKAAAECLQPFDRENLADFLNTAERLRTLLTAEIKA